MTKKGVKVRVPKKIMSRRNFLRLAGGAVVGTAAATYMGTDTIFEGDITRRIKHEIKETAEEWLGMNPDTQGIIVSSNQYFDYTLLNLETLKDMGLRRTYVQKIKTKQGDVFYRTIVGTTDRNHEKTLEKLVQNEHFNPEKKAKPYILLDTDVITPLYKEPKSKRKDRMKTMENQFKLRMEQINEEKEYVNMTVPFIKERYSTFYHESKSTQDAKQIASLIYKAAKEMKVPLVDYTALVCHESKFKNKLGDLKFQHKGTHSEGYIQMRISTQKWVLDQMKIEGIQNLPETVPYHDKSLPEKMRTLRYFPKLQLRMGAWFFKYCLKDSGWDGENLMISDEILNKAKSKYNTGQNANWLNHNYINKVNAEKELFQNSASQPQ